MKQGQHGQLATILEKKSAAQASVVIMHGCAVHIIDVSLWLDIFRWLLILHHGRPPTLVRFYEHSVGR